MATLTDPARIDAVPASAVPEPSRGRAAGSRVLGGATQGFVLVWGASRAWNESYIGAYFFNSVIVVCSGVLLTLLLSSAVAYVLARSSSPAAGCCTTPSSAGWCSQGSWRWCRCSSSCRTSAC